jgi:hypothetical protein
MQKSVAMDDNGDIVEVDFGGCFAGIWVDENGQGGWRGGGKEFQAETEREEAEQDYDV